MGKNMVNLLGEYVESSKDKGIGQVAPGSSSNDCPLSVIKSWLD